MFLLTSTEKQEKASWWEKSQTGMRCVQPGDAETIRNFPTGLIWGTNVGPWFITQCHTWLSLSWVDHAAQHSISLPQNIPAPTRAILVQMLLFVSLRHVYFQNIVVSDCYAEDDAEGFLYLHGSHHNVMVKQFSSVYSVSIKWNPVMVCTSSYWCNQIPTLQPKTGGLCSR